MKKAKKGRRWGWKPDRPDGRDLPYRIVRPPRVPLPRTVDLRDKCSAVEDQGTLGSCTAQAVAGNIEYLDNKPDAVYTDISRLFIYYNTRAIEGSVEYDSGGYLRDTIKTVVKQGYCPEALWPYQISSFTVKPPQEAYKAAKTKLVTSYHRLYTLNDMMTCLADGYPFVFGFTVYESFESAQVAKTGTVPMPGSKERALGGHAVMAVGYNQSYGSFTVRNSWGPNWGQGGYFTLPFEYIRDLADDFWTIRK